MSKEYRILVLLNTGTQNPACSRGSAGTYTVASTYTATRIPSDVRASRFREQIPFVVYQASNKSMRHHPNLPTISIAVITVPQFLDIKHSCSLCTSPTLTLFTYKSSRPTARPPCRQLQTFPTMLLPATDHNEHHISPSPKLVATH